MAKVSAWTPKFPFPVLLPPTPSQASFLVMFSNLHNFVIMVPFPLHAPPTLSSASSINVRSSLIPIRRGNVAATLSGKQTHSEGQCRQWSAVYYTSRPKAESPLSQGPRPVFVKTLYTLSVLAQTHLPKFLETSLDKVKERYNQS